MTFTNKLTLPLFLLLLSSCATTPKKTLSDEITEVTSLIENVKRIYISPEIAEEELKRADKNLLHAKNAVKEGNKNTAQWLIEKARSDAEYAKAKVYTQMYKELLKKREQMLKRHQEQYK